MEMPLFFHPSTAAGCFIRPNATPMSSSAQGMTLRIQPVMNMPFEVVRDSTAVSIHRLLLGQRRFGGGLHLGQALLEVGADHLVDVDEEVERLGHEVVPAGHA